MGTKKKKTEEKENKIIRSPRGKANYPWLNRPDTTFGEPGSYAVNLVLSKKEAKPLCKIIKQIHDDAQIEYKSKNKKKKVAKLPYFENDDGDIEIKFTQRAEIKLKSGETIKKNVVLIDSRKNPTKANVGRGSTIIVAFEPVSFYHPTQGAGCTNRLKAVQIIDLVEYDGSTDYGFDDEDGFVGDEDDSSPDNEEEFDDSEEEEEEDEDEDEPEENDEDDSGEETDEDIPF